jgi:hypothetical protein
MFTKVWIKSTGERLVKTFVQGYVTVWLLVNGVTDPSGITDPGSAFDTMFTANNLKGGAVAAFLSLVTSIASTGLGPDNNSPSLAVTETHPTI